MPEQLIATTGVWYFAACVVAFAAVFVEQAGAARSPEEDAERRGAAGLMLMLASLLTPGLLLLHGFFLTAAVDTLLRIWIMATPVAAILLGSIFGAVFGAVARGAAPTMRKLALPLGLAALALTLFATSPSIVALANGVQDGVLELPVRPV
jgi:ABC-type thiamin/hydroxymethylpyrimidine transport system permease subunit